MAEFAGTLNERIILERPVAARSGTGLRENGWQRYASCLAAISPEGAGAESEGMVLSAMPRFRVVVRAGRGITVDDRVHWAGRLMLVRQVLADPRSRERITLRCEEVRG